MRYRLATFNDSFQDRTSKDIAMDQLLSPKQVAEAIGASESSLKRWCDQGLIPTVKTAGGHRRIPVQEALRFAREQNHSVVEPRILAMPASEDRKARRVEGCAERLTEALLTDNEAAAHAIVFDLFLAGQPVSLIFDEVIAVAFRTIGEKWERHEADVYQERCSCQVMVRALHELRAKQVAPERDLVALGATIEGDQYSLPVTMSEIVLRSVGWDARLLGSSIPFDSMINAVKRHEPGLFWLSISFIPDEAEFISGFNRLFEAASKTTTAIVLGGRALSSEIRTKLRYSAFCDTMRHLEEFAKTLRRQAEGVPKKARKLRKKA
jgi:excisionase family DNA binding protein